LVELVKFASLVITINKAWASWKRIEGALALEPSIAFPERMEGQASPDAPAVEFRHVSLTYPGAASPALLDVDFSALPGQTVGIIGGTGAGKSSLAGLIPRFYEATGGTVLVEGVDVRKWPRAALRRRVGFVMQKASLFKGTIRENLLWGDGDATDAELVAAAGAAQAGDVLAAKGGLDGEISQNGGNLSGGQKQRLTIARALVRRPGILILDDSASALDMATDARLRKAVAALEYRPTTFIISQRCASVMGADLILVLDDGKVVGKGKHGELMRDCDVYREIWESQFGKG